MPNVITCPQCAMQLRVPDTMAPGTSVKCPKCSSTFAVPAASAAPPPPPPAGQFAAPAHAGMGGGPNFGGDPGFPGDRPRDPLQRGTGMEGLSNNYSLDINAIFNRASANFGAMLGPAIGFGCVIIAIAIPVGIVMALAGIIPILGTLIGTVISAAVFAPLTAGFIIVTLRQYRGASWSFGDFFSGFQYWTPLFIVGLITGLVGFVCMLPAEIVNTIAGVDQMANFLAAIQSKGGPPPKPPDPRLALLASGLQLMGGLIQLIIYCRFLVLANYLVVDRGMGGVEAIKGSTELAQGHVLGWIGVSILFGLISALGVLLCCVGLFFTAPFGMLLSVAAYMQVVEGGRQMQNF